MVKVEQVSDSTTESGESNAAEVLLGTYRRNVDILVDGSGDSWTVTVEHKDSNGSWIHHSTFSRQAQNDDTLQIETMATATRAYFDTDVNRLTIYAKGDG